MQWMLDLPIHSPVEVYGLGVLSLGVYTRWVSSHSHLHPRFYLYLHSHPHIHTHSTSRRLIYTLMYRLKVLIVMMKGGFLFYNDHSLAVTVLKDAL